MDESVRRCEVCGGHGKELLINPHRICRHCARETKRFFDPDTNVYTRDDGFIDISPKVDGGVLKKVIKEGKAGAKHIEEGCPTRVQYIGRLMDGSIFDTTRDEVDGKHVGGTDDPFEFHLGRGKVIEGWDIGVATMQPGEISRFIISPQYAYGSQGFAPKVEPDETLDFEIELESFKDPLPKFPTQEEIAMSRKQQAEEDRRMLEENPPPTVDERITNATKEKERGNTHVAQKEYEEAQKCYDSGFVNIFYSKEEWENLLSDEERSRVNQIKLVLYLNRALCKLKLGKIDEAEWDADQAVTLDKDNSKGQFRKGLVFLEKLKRELGKEERKEFWILDKGFQYAQTAEACFTKTGELTSASDAKLLRAQQDLKRQLALLQKCKNKYKQQEKELYKEKIFDRMERANRMKQKKEQQHAQEHEFDDMPPLE